MKKFLLIFLTFTTFNVNCVKQRRIRTGCIIRTYHVDLEKLIKEGERQQKKEVVEFLKEKRKERQNCVKQSRSAKILSLPKRFFQWVRRFGKNESPGHSEIKK